MHNIQSTIQVNSKRLAKIAPLLLLAIFATIVSCGKEGDSATGNNEEDCTSDTVEEVLFSPTGGMALEQLADVPGVGWIVDTIFGVCVPDTVVLWATYNDRYLLTNVRGTEDKFPMLTANGIKALQTDSIVMERAFFKPEARLNDNLEISRDRMKHDNDSILEKRVNEMLGIARDFFTSYGMTKYMSKHMAGNWTRVINDAENKGLEPPNAINGGNIIEFEPGTISVIVDDAGKGEVRVKAYCNDDFTLGGRSGWAMWQMTMCREGRYFKVKTAPHLIKPGNDEFSREMYY